MSEVGEGGIPKDVQEGKVDIDKLRRNGWDVREKDGLFLAQTEAKRIGGVEAKRDELFSTFTSVKAHFERWPEGREIAEASWVKVRSKLEIDGAKGLVKEGTTFRAAEWMRIEEGGGGKAITLVQLVETIRGTVLVVRVARVSEKGDRKVLAFALDVTAGQPFDVLVSRARETANALLEGEELPEGATPQGVTKASVVTEDGKTVYFLEGRGLSSGPTIITCDENGRVITYEKNGRELISEGYYSDEELIREADEERKRIEVEAGKLPYLSYSLNSHLERLIDVGRLHWEGPKATSIDRLVGLVEKKKKKMASPGGESTS